MADLNWVRLDCNFATHDKMLRLKGGKDGWRAIVVYLQSVAWSGGHGTDGFIPRHVLPVLDCTERLMQMLVDVRLWEYGTDDRGEAGLRIPNFIEYQELTYIREMKTKAKQVGGLKGACHRYHGPDCGCWKDRANDL